MRPIESLSRAEALRVRYVLMDIDDTLTTGGKLLPEAYAALWKLREAGLELIPVTGQSAGWCDLILHEWPVVGIIGESGAMAYWEEKGEDGSVSYREAFHPTAVRNDHPVLSRIREKALAEHPGLRVSRDQFCRLCDLALDYASESPSLTFEEALTIKALAEAEGARGAVSSIHINLWMGEYNKLSMARWLLEERYGWDAQKEADRVAYIGDSPNDEPMFGFFPTSCAVANVNRYEGRIAHLPTYITPSECSRGFAEFADILIARRAKQAK